MEKEIIVEKKGYKGYLILNRPDKLNTTSKRVYGIINEALKELDADHTIRVIIMKGMGKCFCAGFDITEAMTDDPDIFVDRDMVKLANDNRWKIWNMTKPVIAQVHGYCLGGGCELMLPCDYVIAAEDALIGEPEVQFGAAPAFLLVPWLVGMRKAKQLMLTGEKVSGKEAARIGLVTEAVPADELEDYVEALANKIVQLSPPVVAFQKIGLNNVYEAQGLHAAISQWEDLSLLFRLLKTDEVKEFEEVVNEKGVKAALKWREEKYADK